MQFEGTYDKNEFLNVQKTSQLLYPVKHQLRKIVEEEICIVPLKVNPQIIEAIINAQIIFVLQSKLIKFCIKI